MKRSKRLSPVIVIAAKDTEAALVKVGTANAAWLADKEQLDDLHRYRAEYLDRFRRGDTLVMSAQKVLELRSFLVHLDQAIEAQTQQVQARYAALARHRVLWQKFSSKEQAMQSLVGRYQDEELKQESRQEQLDNDERNTIQWVRRSR
ncbi:MAG: flagellar export protein FliJ [Pseudomonadota bacterium]|nr:flagellar export protein FliJ [Pseudomonadota bacterium]MDO7711181.1 flagellar export protein FliJ [Pseudomonadota bacterium]